MHARTTEMPTRAYRIAVLVLPIILIAGFGMWFLVSTLDESDAQTSDQSDVAVAPDGSEAQPDAAPAPQQQGPVSAEAVLPLDHLRIATQSFRRGGLGSKALVTFTLRNDNDYAIKTPKSSARFAARTGAIPPSAAVPSTTP
jgi:hypothetical protein